MAKNKQRKKRIKRQLKQRFKQTAATPITPVIVETKEPKEIKSPYLYKGKYDFENQTYQDQLDAVYEGRVQPIERFINQKAIILHHCSDCKKEFYAKPLWLLTKANQRHICGVNMVMENTKKGRKVTDKDKLKMTILFEQGISKSKIAIELGISRSTVITHLKKAGLG
jgi:hypothetical protein